MAEGEEPARLLRAEDAGHVAHREHVALADLVLADEAERLLADEDAADGHGRPWRGGLVTDVDHSGMALVVDMAEDGGLGHGGSGGTPGQDTGSAFQESGG